VLAGLGLAASFRRVGTADALLRLAVKQEPGSEVLSVRLAKDIARHRDRRGAEDVLRACAVANPNACQCALPALASLLDRSAYQDAGGLLVHLSNGCRQAPGAPGMLAEALAGGGETTAARQAADIALGKNRKDPRAIYAKALLAQREGDEDAARSLLEQAIAAGRGARARVDLGLIHYRRAELVPARRQFEAALRDDPDDVHAIYDLALVDQIENRYHQAREGYLRVLRLEPRNADARFNLGVLTHGAGALGEAKHHLVELQKVAPQGDQRVVALQKLFQ
jgi:tetratricopeptide (TPR) repeat protein